MTSGERPALIDDLHHFPLGLTGDAITDSSISNGRFPMMSQQL
jgi:hypothetical protein